MGTIPAGYTPGVWLNSDPGVATATSNTFTKYTTEVDFAQGLGGLDPSTDIRAVACAWETARAGGATGNSGAFQYWGGITNQVYTCAPIPTPAIGSGFVNTSGFLGDAIEYHDSFTGFMYTYINTFVFSLVPGNYVGSAWYLANPTGIVPPTGALLDWETASSTVTNAVVTFTPTEFVAGQSCSINASPIYDAADDSQFWTATTSGNNYIAAGTGGTAATAAPGGSITLSATGAQLTTGRGAIVLRSSLVDANVPPTFTSSGPNLFVYRAVGVSVQITVTAVPPRHRFLYPTTTIPSVVTSPPVLSFTASSNWYQDDGVVDLNVIGDGKPLRFYSPTNSSDSITVHFGAINLGPNPAVGFADVYVVGGGGTYSSTFGQLDSTLFPILNPPITVYASDGSIIQTITGAMETFGVYSTCFTLLPDVRLAGGCSINFTVLPWNRGGATFQEFCISAIILELRTTSPFNSTSVQSGSGRARFNDVIAMR